MSDVKDTSRKSLKEEILSGHVNSQLSDVYWYIRGKGPICDMDLVNDLGLSISSATARRNKLVELGMVESVSRHKSKYTGKIVIYWSVI